MKELEERLKRLERRVEFLENMLFNPVFPQEVEKFKALSAKFPDVIEELSAKFGTFREELRRLKLP
jgi:uncharacterized coiled-coil protein SlyX